MNYGGFGWGGNMPQFFNTNYMVVPDVSDVMRYPVAPGNLITFRVQNQPFLIDKSMEINQFGKPSYKKYRLVEEEMDNVEQSQQVDQLTKSDLAELTKSINSINERIDELRVRIDSTEDMLTKTEDIKFTDIDFLMNGKEPEVQADYKEVNQ